MTKQDMQRPTNSSVRTGGSGVMAKILRSCHQLFAVDAAGKSMTTAANRKPGDTRLAYWGGCPKCSRQDGFFNVGRVHWFYCDTHKTKWSAGANLFRWWRQDSPDHWKRNENTFSKYEEVAPIYSTEQLPRVDSASQNPSPRRKVDVPEGPYNDFANYETWKMSLWWKKDGDNFRKFRALARDIAACTPAYTAAGLAAREATTQALAAALREELELGSPMLDQATVYADLLHAALGRVAWYEVAEELLTDIA